MSRPFRTLDLNLLRVFDAVMAEGSLTRAAAALAMTQPAVSHAIKRLRLAVGEALFTRTANGMRPTPRARELWPPVREALSQMRQALSPDAFDPATDAVHFRLALADITAALLSPPLVQRIERDGLALSLSMLPLTDRDPRKLLEAGDADLAIGHFPQVMASLGQDVQASAPWRHTRLYSARQVCVMRRGHPLADQPLSWDTFCAARHLLVSFSGQPEGSVDQQLDAMGRSRRIVLTVNPYFAASRVVAQSDLLTVLPQGLVEAAGTPLELVSRPLPVELPLLHVDMLWHRRLDGHPAHEWLRSTVADAATEVSGALGS